MREAHQPDDKNAVVSVSGKPGSSGAHNHEMGHTQGEDLTGSQGTSRRVRRNKRNARQQGVEIHPDQDESYVGNVDSVDDLVKYINNDISAENLKGNCGGNNVSGLSDTSVAGTKATKRKERNKVKTLETAGAEASESQGTSSVSENASVKQAESEEPDCISEIRLEMGNLSSAENLETKDKEDGERSSFSDVTPQESENDKKKTVRNETIKQESNKAHQKNNMVSNNRTPLSAKPSKTKNINDKVKVEDKSTDGEAVKTKTSKKNKSKSVKKSVQESPKRVTSPAPPSPVEVPMPLEIPESVQEQWCKVVSKPQKKKRSQAQTSSTQQSFSSPSVAHQTRAKDSQTSSPSYPYDPHRRSQQYSSVQTPSGKPVSYSLPYLKTNESENRGKDLSPSDFPVLNSSPRDLRRSLENVFDTGALISDKDSDKESSKSFPADIGLVDRCKTKYPISYATMASGSSVLESVDSSKAESMSSCDSSVEFPANSSSLKWKGSPQERRHSIGSAPKEVSKGVLQRTGSQEMIHCDKDLGSPPATIPTSNASCKNNLVSSDSTGSFSSSEADSARSSEICSDGTGEECITISTYITSSSHARVSAETKQATNSYTETGENVMSASQKTTAAKSIPVDSVLRSHSVRTESKVSSPGAKQIGNGRTKRGVVFCCNDDEKGTPISGLHFGFFHEEEPAPVVTNSALNTLPPVPSSSEEVSNSVPEDNACSSGNINNRSRSSQQPVAAAAGSGSVSSDNKPSKGPHIPGLNGFVCPQTPPSVLVHSFASHSSVTAEQTPIQPPPSSPARVGKDSASDVGPETPEVGSKVEENMQRKVCVPYGRRLKKDTLDCVVYLRTPEEMPALEPSVDLSQSTGFLYLPWEKKNGQWSLFKNNPTGKVYSLKEEGIISPKMV